MEADWDLHAVVRGCSSSTSQPSVVPPSGSQIPRDEGSPLLVCQQPFLASRTTTSEDLHDLYKPFFPKPVPFSWQNSPLSCSSSSSSLASSLSERTKSGPSIFGQVQRPSAGFRAASQASKSKKRKNTQKKVCEVPAESVSSDVWAWRKYGQKPIKGSPFPRSYYRCSSSKGCLARKQVERNRSDSGMFIITYTAEHNHPAPAHKNSLAGVPRQKHQPSHSLTPPSEITSSESNVQAATPCSSPNASPEEEEAVLRGRDSPDEREDRAAGGEDTFGSDDFFAGLEGLTGDPWDPIQACFSFQWTAAAGGGVGS